MAGRTFAKNQQWIGGSGIGTASSQSWQYAPGYQFGVIERTSSNFTTTQTTQALADTALTMASITFDGSTAINIELICTISNNQTGVTTRFNLWEDSTDLGCIVRSTALNTNSDLYNVYGLVRRTPTAGAKVYTIRGWVSGASTGTMYLANGTTVPGSLLRITRA